jgi:hypothetical protein
MRADNVIGSEFPKRMAKLTCIEALDGASQTGEQGIPRHLVGRMIQVRPDGRMALDELDIIFGVKRPEAPRHQRHHVDMPRRDVGKMRCGFGAERLSRAAMSRACGDAQKQNTFGFRHRERQDDKNVASGTR